MFLDRALATTRTAVCGIFLCCAAAVIPHAPAGAAELHCVATTSLDALRTEYDELLAASRAVGFNAPLPKFLSRPQAETARQAATICRSVIMSGTIASGDAARVSEFFRENPFAQRIYLNVSGANVLEGMQVGRNIRQAHARTVAPLAADGDAKSAVLVRNEVTALQNLCAPGAPCRCSGACFHIWAGGVAREGNTVSGPDDQGTESPDATAYLAQMGIPPEWTTKVAGMTTPLPDPLPPELKYAPEIGKEIANQCGKEPSAADLSASQKLAPGEAKPIAKVQLGRTYEGWRACTELVAAR